MGFSRHGALCTRGEAGANWPAATHTERWANRQSSSRPLVPPYPGAFCNPPKAQGLKDAMYVCFPPSVTHGPSTARAQGQGGRRQARAPILRKYGRRKDGGETREAQARICPVQLSPVNSPGSEKVPYDVALLPLDYSLSTEYAKRPKIPNQDSPGSPAETRVNRPPVPEGRNPLSSICEP